MLNQRLAVSFVQAAAADTWDLKPELGQRLVNFLIHINACRVRR